jgi:transcription termination factor Rho
MREIKLHELKLKSPTELLSFAEEHEVENASIMRKQELMFAILKQVARRVRISEICRCELSRRAG